MINNTYAPIVIFVYRRVDKTKNLISLLSKNHLASESEVFIFSDGSKGEKDKKSVNEVRDYIDSIESDRSFKRVIVKKADCNHGLAESIITGITEVISKYKKVIVLEDDLILSDTFLEYMNECLEFYKDDKRIWSISGYTPDLFSLESYDKNVYLCYKSFSWGWGTWKDRWDLVDWDVKDYNSFRFNLMERTKLSRGGDDLLGMLRDQMKGRLDSWAIRWGYSQMKHDGMTIAPRYAYSVNDGLDGSGTHSVEADVKQYKNELKSSSKVNWCYDDLEPDKKIISEYKKLFHESIFRRLRIEGGAVKRRIKEKFGIYKKVRA